MVKKWIGLSILLILLATSILVLFWMTNPTRTANAFIDAIEAQDYETALALAGEDIKPERLADIEFFVEDWTSWEDAPTVVVERDESWKMRVVTDDNGNVILNKHGNRDKEIIPVPKYWAHYYSLYVTVTFAETDELEAYEEPMIITLHRKTDDTWGFFGNIFRGWTVNRVRYQPLTDEELEEYEFDIDDVGDLEDFEFTVDDNGEIIINQDDSSFLEEGLEVLNDEDTINLPEKNEEEIIEEPTEE